jgi:glycosyltransferase involved in cell wall biosynthesis
MKVALSLVIITLNEENDIARCIESVPFAQEIIVVDSLSKDKTRDIALKLGAKVIEKQFLGYRAQKQFAIDQATCEWVLSLDADEALSSDLQSEILAHLLNLEFQSRFNGFKMPRLSFYLGRWIRHGGWYPDYQTRLFKKDKGVWTGGAVHESVEVDGSVGKLKGDIHHFVFRDLNEQVNANNEFSSLGSAELLKKAKNFSLLKLVFKPIGKFIECYLWKLGFLDGVQGFIIALGASQSIFLKYAKLWEAKKSGTLRQFNP